MGNRHFDRKVNNILPCSGMSRDDTSSSEASSLRSSKSSSSCSSSSARTDDDESAVSPDHFRVIRRIGKGSFCQVYAVERRHSGELYAMKLVDKDSGTESIRSVTNEVDILSSLSHPFIVTLWYAFQDVETIYLVFELLPGGDLRHSLEELHHLPESRVLVYVSEVALVLDYLRTKRVLHRDIKPENLLLDGQGHIRLTDFNVAVELQENELATSLSGTKPYIAPEVYRCILNMGQGYTHPADWWSLGVCAFELVCGQRPYDIHSRTSNEDILGMILLRNLNFPRSVTADMAGLIRQLLCVESEQRLCSVEQLKAHPLLADVNFEQLSTRQAVTEHFDPLSES